MKDFIYCMSGHFPQCTTMQLVNYSQLCVKIFSIMFHDLFHKQLDNRNSANYSFWLLMVRYNISNNDVKQTSRIFLCKILL